MRSSGSAVLVISLTLLVLLLHLFPSNASFNRSSFPSGFLFGTASSAYQYEGGAKEGGRRPSIWDTYTQRYPAVTPAWPDLILIPGLHEHDEKIKDHSSGDVAVDSYHRYKEDVGIMKDMGLDAFRFSISWPRVLPYGKLSGGDGVNKEGIDYYNKLVNELKANGIEPFVTLFHWDLPQTLEDEYGGFLSSRIVDDFRDYAELCFKEFGDRVKHWITLNEPWTYSTAGYAAGSLAPGRCSDWQMLHCTGGDSSTEPYLVSHHQLLAHASVVQLYRQKYQASQKGEIGITLVSNWMIPYSETKDQHSAAARALDFMLGWFMDPLTKGEYPKSMRSIVGSRLPKFSKEESAMVTGSFDFIGLNYYTANYAANSPYHNSVNASYLTDSQANLTTEKNGILIGKKAASDWLYVYPKGIRNLLAYTKAKYNIPVIYITENGIDEIGNLPLEEALADHWRVDYYHRHLSYVLKAIREDDVNVGGFFAWSLLDNFEWVSGYTVRFGINYVDYKDNLKRYPKQSAHWFKKLLSN